MKCDNCGYETHPGDQVCINCGATLSISHTLFPSIEQINKEEKMESKKNRLFLLICILGVIFLIAIIVIFIFLFLKR